MWWKVQIARLIEHIDNVYSDFLLVFWGAKFKGNLSMSSTIVRQQESHQEIAEVSINSCVSACEKSHVWRTAMILGNQPTELPIGCKREGVMYTLKW